jgi:3-methyladenine DNA glycosylase/8-oxoguanine DNA glycosylase
MTVDPMNIPESMSKEILEYWILFAICVCNKSAKLTSEKMEQFMALSDLKSPFEKVREMDRHSNLDFCLRLVKFGQYKRIEKAMRAAIDLNLMKLETTQPNEALKMLMDIPGIGPKTARMILMYAFPAHADLWVPLDTHILKFLRTQGYLVPRNTPPEGLVYNSLQEAFHNEAQKRHMTMRELDTKVWTAYAEGEDISNL